MRLSSKRSKRHLKKSIGHYVRFVLVYFSNFCFQRVSRFLVLVAEKTKSIPKVSVDGCCYEADFFLPLNILIFELYFQQLIIDLSALFYTISQPSYATSNVIVFIYFADQPNK